MSRERTATQDADALSFRCLVFIFFAGVYNPTYLVLDVRFLPIRLDDSRVHNQ